MIIETIMIIVVAFIIASLPLHMAARMLGGKSTILKAIGVNIISSLIISAIYSFLPYASLLAFFALIWIYREMFRLKWFKAFLVWIIQATLTFLFILIFAILFGISLII